MVGLFWLFMACTADIRPTRERAEIWPAWTEHTTKDSQTFQAHLYLSEDLPLSGAALLLEGLSGYASLQLNGQTLPDIEGSWAPIEVALPPLKYGDNDFFLRIRSGGPSLGYDTTVPLLNAPRLILREATHIQGAGLWAEGDHVRAVARVTGGTKVRFRRLDQGEVVEDLGTFPVQNKTVLADAQSWRGPRWQLGSGGMVTIEIDLFDGERLVDRYLLHTGVRQLTLDNGQLRINALRVPLLGLRHSFNDMRYDMRILQETGLNALEFHGQPISLQMLEMADRAGLALVIMPRCEGHIRYEPRFRMNYLLSQEQLITRQDSAGLALLMGHPSVLLWVLEGGMANQSWLQYALSDPLQPRPIVGLDLQSFAVDAQHPPGPGWVVEVMGDDPTINLPILQNSQHSAGGILSYPTEITNWLSVVQSAKERLLPQVKPIQTIPTPAQATLQAPAGELRWLESRRQNRMGVQSNAEGQVMFNSWEEGTSDIAGQPVIFKSDAWKQH